MSIFFDFVRTSLFRSKKHFLLSRLSKNVSFWLFLLKKKGMRKRTIFWQKPWTNPFSKCRFFSTMLELQLSGLKSILFFPEDQKMFLSGFLCSKEQMIKRSIFWGKPWTNPLHNVDFLKFFRTNLLWSKKHSFLSRISKIFLSAFCCSKKKHMRKRSVFWQKPLTNPFAKCRFFLLC